MNTTNIAQRPPPLQQSGLPQSSSICSSTPQEPQQTGIGERQPVTVIGMDSNPGTPAHSSTSRISRDPAKVERRSTPPGKHAIGVVAALLSLITIGISFATIQEPDGTFNNPAGPLAAGVIVTLVNLIIIAWVCSLSIRKTSFGILFPIIFSGLSGLMIVIYFASAQSRKDFNYVFINYWAVLTCAAVFGGMGLGGSVEYLVVDKNEKE